MASPDTHQGDPAYSGDSRLTHEPIREEERGRRGGRGGPDWGSAETYVWPGMAVVVVALAVVIGLTAGWAYAIPVGVFVALAAFFFLGHGALARRRQQRYGGVEPARRAVRENADDPVPSVDFEERGDEPTRQ
jgi:hypothetical protein